MQLQDIITMKLVIMYAQMELMLAIQLWTVLIVPVAALRVMEILQTVFHVSGIIFIKTHA